MLYTLMLTSMHSLGEDVLLLMKMEKTLEKIARFNYITNEQLISPPKKRGIEDQQWTRYKFRININITYKCILIFYKLT